MVCSKTSVGEKSEPRALIVGIHTIARMLGLSRPACHELVSAGIIRRKSYGKYDAIEVATDFIAHQKRQLVAAREGNADFQTSRAGLIEEKRRLAELERERLEGNLLRVDLIEGMVGELVTMIRNAFLGLGPRLAMKLAGRDARSIAIEIEDETRRICNDFAAGAYRVPEKAQRADGQRYRVPRKEHAEP
jgi:hypothetical protein